MKSHNLYLTLSDNPSSLSDKTLKFYQTKHRGFVRQMTLSAKSCGFIRQSDVEVFTLSDKTVYFA